MHAWFLDFQTKNFLSKSNLKFSGLKINERKYSEMPLIGTPAQPIYYCLNKNRLYEMMELITTSHDPVLVENSGSR